MMPTPAPTTTDTTIDHKRHARWQRRHGLDQRREAEAHPNAEDRAEEAERRGLDEELRENVAPLGAERLADADLARAVRDGDEHDVHDHDRADDEPDRRQAQCRRSRAPA